MARTITRETKKGRPKKGQKTYNPQEPNERKDLIPSVLGNYITHGPYNVTCMQIMRSNNNERSRTSITHQHNFLFYNKG